MASPVARSQSVVTPSLVEVIETDPVTRGTICAVLHCNSPGPWRPRGLGDQCHFASTARRLANLCGLDVAIPDAVGLADDARTELRTGIGLPCSATEHPLPARRKPVWRPGAQQGPDDRGHHPNENLCPHNWPRRSSRRQRGFFAGIQGNPPKFSALPNLLWQVEKLRSQPAKARRRHR